MSNKAQALVWDLDCPMTYGEITFRPSHKYVLVSYADHADHNGRNIWPAVPTIARKTGLDERTVQRLTHDLEAIGLLVEDGHGPRGTNKWRLPYSPGGDRLSPVTFAGGDIQYDSLGDIPSGDTVPPELTQQDIYILTAKLKEDDLFQKIHRIGTLVFDVNTPAWHQVERELLYCDLSRADEIITVAGLGERAEYYQSRYTKIFQRAAVGVFNAEIEISFCE